MRLLLIAGLGAIILGVAACANQSANALRSNDGVPIYSNWGSGGGGAPAC